MNYLELLESYKDDIIEVLGELIAIPSVNEQAVRTQEGEVLPFGRNVKDALDYMLKKGGELGFEPYNAENYGGHLDFVAENVDKPETFAVVGHLDVVPAGNGWNTDPFKLEIKDGNLYGRGVSDDKGPVVAALYAMKALKEAGLKPKKNIRLIMGLDEELGVDGIAKYLEIAGQPDMGFTPDGYFPLINGETGILIFDLAQKLTRQTTKDGLRLTKLEAGTASNAVPGNAKAVVAGDDSVYTLIKDRLAQYVIETGYNIKAKKQGSSLVIEAVGIGAHGAKPHEGLNAVSIMMDFLGRLQFSNEEVNEFIAFYNDYIGFDLHGERLGCDFSDEASGKLILNVGMAKVSEELASLTINIRYPVSCTSEQVFGAIESSIGRNKIGIIKDSDMVPIFMGIDDPMTKKLIEVYREETGDAEAMPYVETGGTYAKEVNKTLAYGAMFPGEADTMHQANECKSIELLMKAARIYARALYEICF